MRIIMKHFIKVEENFTCQNCSKKVKGSGYTNHCPKCLYSMHVDGEVPGDRSSKCRGIMKPVGVDKKGDAFMVIHECVKCRKRIRNKIAKNDDIKELLKLGM